MSSSYRLVDCLGLWFFLLYLSVFRAALHLWFSWCRIYVVHSWLTVVLQYCNTVGWVILIEKFSWKWPMMCFEWHVKLHYTQYCEMQCFLLSLWVCSSRQSEGSVVLYCYRFMSSVSPVKSHGVHVQGCRAWVICCNYISATFIVFLCTLCMTAMCMCVIQVNAAYLY